MNPRPSLLNPNFHYTPSARTDIRKTIRREQKRLADLKAAQETADAEAWDVFWEIT